MAIFGIALTVGIGYAGSQLLSDLADVHPTSAMPFILLGIALLVALGFEFVNGFHDTANAVATVIYTHTLAPQIAVVWSGLWNFIGVLVSTGAVAFGIISLLPVELILQVGGGAGFAMVFALLTAAIIWNLGTWYFGLPSSSSHTLIGSIIGVGLANQLMARQHRDERRRLAPGPEHRQVAADLADRRLRRLPGCSCSRMRKVIMNKALYEAPDGEAPPPFWIRCLLLLTCTGVSFAHGSNDGQKGMGLIMLILIGTVPTAYALNHAVSAKESQDFIAVSPWRPARSGTTRTRASPSPATGGKRSPPTSAPASSTRRRSPACAAGDRDRQRHVDLQGAAQRPGRPRRATSATTCT